MPAGASQWQEILCLLDHSLAGIMTTKGANAPIVEYIDTKCNVPTANTGTGTTA